MPSNSKPEKELNPAQAGKDPLNPLQPAKDPLTLLIERNPCPLCRALKKPKCGCSAGGGSSGSDAGGHEDKEETRKSARPEEKLVAEEDQKSYEIPDTQGEGLLLVPTDSRSAIDKLIELLVNNPQDGILILRLKANLSPEERVEAQKFLDTIKNEFNEFVEKLEAQGIATTGFSALMKDNGLEIHIPDRNQYQAFLSQLQSKNLLPKPMMEKASPPLKTSSFNPSPLKQRPEPNRSSD